MVRSLSCFALCFVVACGSGGEEPDGGSTPTETGDTGTALAETPDYAAWGPWSVGTAQGEIDGPEGPLTAQFWYPSDDPQGSPERYDGLLEGVASEGLTPACEEVRPVMVFSHGLGGVRWQSPFFVEHLASHGFLVVAVDHTGSTLTDTDFALLGEVAMRRPLDVAAAFDGAVSAYPDCVDPDAGYAVSGHSFGGYTAFAVAGAELNDPTNGGAPTTRGDDRAWAMVALAPWDGSGVISDGTRLVDIPAMVLTGRQDETTPLLMVRRLWNAIEVAPRAFGIIDNAGHYTFSPVACLLETGDGCGDAFLQEEEVNPIIQQAAAAFLFEQLGVEGASDQVGVERDVMTWDVVR